LPSRRALLPAPCSTPSLASIAVACLLLGKTFAFVSNGARKKGERKGRRREERWIGSCSTSIIKTYSIGFGINFNFFISRYSNPEPHMISSYSASI
jgi:hypothetical protein